MKSSTYLNWFRRLLLLGAVIAGVTASAAGAVGRPPDVQDTASSIAGTFVGSPPDVQDAAAALHSTPAGLRADGLRLQGMAQVYQQLQNTPTAQGLEADGLRLQGIAEVYKQLQSSAVPDVFERYAAAHPYGGQSSATESTLVGRPPDVRDAAGAVSELTSVDRIIAQERGRHADLGLFGTGTPSNVTQGFSLGVPVEYLAQPAPSSGGNGFDWADWGIGIGSGFGIMLLLAAGLAGGLQRRHRMQTA